MTTPTREEAFVPWEIETSSGSTLHGRFYRNSAPRGIVVVSHGLGEHSACYDELASELSRIDGLVDVLTFDYRGHGKSSGKRGYVRDYREFVDDLQAALRWARSQNPSLPLFVMGHSNGGLVALHAALVPDLLLDGMILSNPSIKVSARIPLHKYYAGVVLRKVAPRVTMTSTVLDEQLTSDPVHLAARKNDLLRHARINAPLFFGMVEGGAWVASQAEKIRVPLLMILGGADPVIDPKTSEEFFARVSSTDKTLKIFPRMLHEPLNEIGREVVVAEIVSWLRDHVAP